LEITESLDLRDQPDNLVNLDLRELKGVMAFQEPLAQKEGKGRKGSQDFRVSLALWAKMEHMEVSAQLDLRVNKESPAIRVQQDQEECLGQKGPRVTQELLVFLGVKVNLALLG